MKNRNAILIAIITFIYGPRAHAIELKSVGSIVRRNIVEKFGKVHRPIRQAGFIWDHPSGTQSIKNIEYAREGIRSLWWNIEGGTGTNAAELDGNIVALARSSITPDIIALGEARQSSLQESTWKVLSALYPYRKWVPYNENTGEYGIVILSKVEPKVDPYHSHMDWVPKGLVEKDADAYREKWYLPRVIVFDRTYSEFQFQIKGINVSFVPVHLTHAWEKLSGPKDLAAEVAIGKSNPTAVQGSELNRILKQRMNVDGIPPPLIMGDFNLPSFSRSFQITKNGFKDPFSKLDSIMNPTYPATGSTKAVPGPVVKIDHSFISPELESTVAEVLRLKGSDHYPIYVIVKDK